MYDLLIQNVRLIDGTGAPWTWGSLAVRDGKIAAVGAVEGPAREVVDGEGACLAPGFIDIHSHSDGALLRCPTAESRILQGVTTDVGGNCGSSVAPSDRFPGLTDYFSALEQAQPSINSATLVGHGTLRKAAMGYSREAASPAELAEMSRLATVAMEEGAFGISSGLIYPPGCYANTEELVQVVSAVRPYAGYYATHMRNESFDVVKSVQESLHVAKEAGVRLQISHHKVTYKPHWQVSCKTTIAMIEQARRQGQDVACDQYPYNASATSMSSNVPSWAFEGGVDAMLARLRDPETRAKLRAESNASHEGRWGNIHVAYLQTEQNQWMVGKSILEIAETLGKDPADTCFDIVLEENNHVGEVNFGMCEEDIEYIMSRPFVMPGSDGSAKPLDEPGKPHPRNYGTFVRYLAKYCRDRKLFPLETAIQRMTSLPASRIGLPDRGLLKAGMWADLVLFEPEALKDDPDYQYPQQACSGILQVYVNGVLTAKDGRHTGARAGQVLKRGK